MRHTQVIGHSGASFAVHAKASMIPLERNEGKNKLGRGGTASSMTSSHRNVMYNGVKGLYGYRRGCAEGYARVPAGPPKKRLVLGDCAEE